MDRRDFLKTVAITGAALTNTALGSYGGINSDYQ